MLPPPFEFVTDTATLVVFDPRCLKHRRDDDADWWCWPPEEQISETNAGNAAFVDLGADGKYQVRVFFTPLTEPTLEVKLDCPSGKLFVGAGEETTCEGGEPECLRGGLFVVVQPGVVLLRIRRESENCLLISVQPHAGQANNTLRERLQLPR